MKTGHEVATLDLMTSRQRLNAGLGRLRQTLICCNIKRNIKYSVAAVKISGRNISEVKKIAKILSEHLMNSGIRP